MGRERGFGCGALLRGVRPLVELSPSSFRLGMRVWDSHTALLYRNIGISIEELYTKIHDSANLQQINTPIPSLYIKSQLSPHQAQTNIPPPEVS